MKKRKNFIMLKKGKVTGLKTELLPLFNTISPANSNSLSLYIAET